MKILVFGHSDSDGSKLASREDAWPWLVQRDLAERGVEAEVVHKLLFAGPTAVQFVERSLEKESPDVVVVATSTFNVLIQLVSRRVREVLGDRAGDFAMRTEQLVARHPGPSGSRRAVVLAEARKVGRKLVGTRGDFSVDELVSCYEQCFRAIAQQEDVHGIAIGGAAYTSTVWRMNPGAEAQQEVLNAGFHEAAIRHHLDWFSHETLLGGPKSKLPYYHKDGVHTDERSHRLVANPVVELVIARL